MALSIERIISGVALPNIYARVEMVTQNRAGGSNTVMVVEYADAALSETLRTKQYHFPHEQIIGDVLAWAYNKLKTLPEFAGAIDV